jgi:hypothetical protein
MAMNHQDTSTFDTQIAEAQRETNVSGNLTEWCEPYYSMLIMVYRIYSDCCLIPSKCTISDVLYPSSLGRELQASLRDPIV